MRVYLENYLMLHVIGKFWVFWHLLPISISEGLSCQNFPFLFLNTKISPIYRIENFLFDAYIL